MMDEIIKETDDAGDPITGFAALYESMQRCRRMVSWKPSVKHFTLNGLEECVKMARDFEKGVWKHGKPRHILITCPKRREGLSIPFRDRVYQRSLNDNALYPKMTRSFIYDNAACQKGKGPDFARARLKKFLWNFYSHHGLDGYVLQMDIHGYYPTMRHDLVRSSFSRHLLPRELDMAMSVLSHQYAGEVGFNPGSQMVQIAGISVLDPLDHYIKERLHMRYYIRYMDDLWMLSDDRQLLEQARQDVTGQLARVGFAVHEGKTRIIPLRSGFRFLGFDWRMTETGRIIQTIDSSTVRRERRKLRRMAALVASGQMAEEKMEECYRSWKEHASHGDSYYLLRRMDRYYKKTLEECRNGYDQETGPAPCR